MKKTALLLASLGFFAAVSSAWAELTYQGAKLASTFSCDQGSCGFKGSGETPFSQIYNIDGTANILKSGDEEWRFGFGGSADEDISLVELYARYVWQGSGSVRFGGAYQTADLGPAGLIGGEMIFPAKNWELSIGGDLYVGQETFLSGELSLQREVAFGGIGMEAMYDGVLNERFSIGPFAKFFLYRDEGKEDMLKIGGGYTDGEECFVRVTLVKIF